MHSKFQLLSWNQSDGKLNPIEQVSAEIAAATVGQSSKTALLLAAGTGNEQVITELVA